VLDPFSGSATTIAVAKKLGRHWLGFDVSADYVERGRARLEAAHVGAPLEGAPEPLVSAPATPEANLNGKKKSGRWEKGRPLGKGKATRTKKVQ
jgi:site-specific DNA-methyltransferase (adenine-specific)